MSITAPKGFRAAGIAAGIKSNGRRDLALVVNDGPRADAAAVFTSNRCLANPVIWSKGAITSGTARAVILNSGGANCFTGRFGFGTTRMTAQAVAEHVNVSSSDVLVCSTGLIGTGGEAFRSAVLGGVPKVVEQLGNTASHASGAAEAILRPIHESRKLFDNRLPGGRLERWQRAQGCSHQVSRRCSSSSRPTRS